MSYDIKTLSTMMGVTTRTIRNYMHLGLLKGYIEHGKWCFTSQEIDLFLSNSYVQKELEIKANSIVLDYLKQNDRYEIGCFVMNLSSIEYEKKLPEILNCVNERKNVRFFYYKTNKISRICVEGSLDTLSQIIELLKPRKNS